jgi:hypothetical protein
LPGRPAPHRGDEAFEDLAGLGRAADPRVNQDLGRWQPVTLTQSETGLQASELKNKNKITFFRY